MRSITPKFVRLEKSVGNLTYISETDAAILPFSIKGTELNELIPKVLSEFGLPSESPIAERDFEQFFARLTRVYEGANERSKQSAERFSTLRELLARNLKGIRVLAIGSIRVTLVIAGFDNEGSFTGIHTSAVET